MQNKITKKVDENFNNEYEINKRIKRIHCYQYYFIPFLDVKKIILEKIKNTNNILINNNKNEEFIVIEYNFQDCISIKDYLNTYNEQGNKLLDLYYFVIYEINIMNNNHIYFKSFDDKNIVINEDLDYPFITNFYDCIVDENNNEEIVKKNNEVISNYFIELFKKFGNKESKCLQELRDSLKIKIKNSKDRLEEYEMILYT